jgi:DNA replication protein DnaC
LERGKKEATKFVIEATMLPYSGGGYTLTFCGLSDTGKTMLAKAILAELRLNAWGHCDAVEPAIIKGHLTRFTAELFDWRKVSDGFKDGKWGYVEAMEEPWLTVLDDVGADYDPRKIAVSKLDQVLRSRHGKWTVITCNMTLEQIAEQMDPRISSWLIRDGNTVVEINATPFHLRPK